MFLIFDLEVHNKTIFYFKRHAITVVEPEVWTEDGSCCLADNLKGDKVEGQREIQFMDPHCKPQRGKNKIKMAQNCDTGVKPTKCLQLNIVNGIYSRRH